MVSTKKVLLFGLHILVDQKRQNGYNIHMKQTEKTCSVTAMTLLAVFIGTAIVNDCTGYDEVVGEPYFSYYSYCSKYSYGPKGITTCVEMSSAHEKRVNTIHYGMLWTRDSYKVVR